MLTDLTEPEMGEKEKEVPEWLIPIVIMGVTKPCLRRRNSFVERKVLPNISLRRGSMQPSLLMYSS